MKKFKKVTKFLLLMIVVLALFAGCKGNDPANSGDSGAGNLSQVNIKQIGEEAAKLFEKVESVHISQTVDAEITMGGNTNNMNVNLESDVNVAQNSMHSVAKSKSGPLTMEMEMYVIGNGVDATVYANVNNSSWMKQEVPFAQLKASSEYSDAYAEAQFLLAALQGAERTEAEYEGKAAIKVSGTLDLSDPEGAMEGLGLVKQTGLTTAQFQQMLTGLEGVNIDVYFDKATGLPLEITIDMTDFMTSVYENLSKAFGNGHSMEISVGHAIGTYKFTNYNNVTVEVPAEVEESISGI